MHAPIDLQREKIAATCARARDGQKAWAAKSIANRLGVIRDLRHLLAGNAEALARAAAAVNDRPVAEKLVSEVLPLADACRWLEREAARVLRPRYGGIRRRPLWLTGVSFDVQRQPLGLVLVIGPANYPLFLPAVQALQALAAGNAVLIKPAPGTAHVMEIVLRFARVAGVDPTLLTVLSENVQAARDAIGEGVDKVIFTGSSENGRELLKALAESNTPAVMELSGEDPVIVFADADLDLVVRALEFGVRLNHGETCIAPRRLIVASSIADDLRRRLGGLGLPMGIFFGENDLLERLDCSEFALGASIFSRDIARARALAQRIQTGFVVINDLIVPTADPRLPFGGVKASGFGSTRGEEGLLEMTHPHVVTVRRGKSSRHFDEHGPANARLFASYIQATHGRGPERLRAVRDLIRTWIDTIRNPKS
jgi:acyl-CoA reductase-like NAD-dependent aldehyde dehydrogenase